MSLLQLERVVRRARGAGHEQVLLREATLVLDAGELVAVWGPREGGRRTLLRIAAGIERPDSGVVRFAGEPLCGRPGELLGRGIGYSPASVRGGEAHAVLEELTLAQLAHGIPRRSARQRALAALQRTDAAACGARELTELDGAEAVRVALAQALVLEPSLLVVEDPVKGVDLLARDALLALLRSLADEGLAVLFGAGEATALSGADRVLSLSDGVLRGTEPPPAGELAAVLPLRRRTSA